MMELFWTTLDDLAERRGRPPSPRNPAVLEELMGHFAATDPESSLVAEDRGRIVAFGMLHVRGDTGFLAFLFVHPSWQGRGLGRAILDACRDGAGRPPRMGTCAEADQPVSTGIYASIGMAPQMPLYLLRGGLSPYRLPSLPDGIRARPMTPTDVVAIDDEVLGYQHPVDHAFLARAGRHGWAFEDAGVVVGYGYVQPSGRLGPVAAADPQLLPGLHRAPRPKRHGPGGLAGRRAGGLRRRCRSCSRTASASTARLPSTARITRARASNATCRRASR